MTPAYVRPNRWPIGLASLVILGTLGAQTLAISAPFIGLFTKEPGYLWPFLNYPMYCAAHRAGDHIDRFVIVVTSPKGSETTVSHHDLGLGFWQLLEGLVPALLGQNAREVAVYLQHYEHLCGRRVTAVRLENHPWVLGKDGAAPGPVRVITRMTMERHD